MAGRSSGGGAEVALRGRRAGVRHPDRPLIDPAPARADPSGRAPASERPPLDGTLEASTPSRSLLDHEDQYRRSEEPYPGPEEFSAARAVGWADRSTATSQIDGHRPGRPVFRAAERAAAPASTTSPTTSTATACSCTCIPTPDGRCTAFSSCPIREAGAIRVRGAGGTAGRPEMVPRRLGAQPTRATAMTRRHHAARWEPRLG